jgi:hypothetical protein
MRKTFATRCVDTDHQPGDDGVTQAYFASASMVDLTDHHPGTSTPKSGTPFCPRSAVSYKIEKVSGLSVNDTPSACQRG